MKANLESGPGPTIHTWLTLRYSGARRWPKPPQQKLIEGMCGARHSALAPFVFVDMYRLLCFDRSITKTHGRGGGGGRAGRGDAVVDELPH